MSSNLIQILNRLTSVVLSSRRCGPDIQSDTPMELADDQSVIRTGVIYLVSQNSAEPFLENATIQPGACLMVSDVTQEGRFINHPACHSITVVEFHCHFEKMYNQLTKAISWHFRNGQCESNLQCAPQQEQLLTFWKQIRNNSLQGTLEIKESLRQICPDFKAYIRLIVSSAKIPLPDRIGQSLYFVCRRHCRTVICFSAITRQPVRSSVSSSFLSKISEPWRIGSQSNPSWSSISFA